MNKNYKEYLKSNEWKEIKSLVLKRDGNKCIKCGNTNNLQVHHTTYSNIFNEAENLNDLITLCGKCHMEEHNIEVCKNDDFMLKVSNNFIMQETKMKPNEYVLYLAILKLIQQTKGDKDKYTFIRLDLDGIFNEQTYKKSKLNKILNGMIDSQLEDILLSCDYDGKDLTIIFDRFLFDRYFMIDSNYTTIDIMDIVGSKGIQSIKMIMLLNRFSKTGWIKIKEEDIRIILGKIDSNRFKTKHITWDVKNIVKKFNEKYTIKDFVVDRIDNSITYEFTFNKFNNTIGGNK